MQHRPIAEAKHPVTIKFDVHGKWFVWSSMFNITSAIILPTLAFIAQNPIKSPPFPLPNQFPIMPITPGQPVL